MSLKRGSFFKTRLLPCAALVVAAGVHAPVAMAQTSASEIDEMKRTIQELQTKIESIEAAQAKQAAMQATPAPAPAKSTKYDGIQAGPLNIKFGGFLEFASIYRDDNEAADVGSSYSAIPYANSSSYHLSEFRETARQSRLSMLVTGPSDGHQHAEGYYEMDFLGAAQTANSKESNSYNPRIRHIYGTYYNDDAGFYLLAGQTWSLMVQEKKGMNPRDEMPPSTIEAQYVPGFNWTRNPQVRFVEKFSPMVSAGFSIESPQALFAGKAPAGVISTVAAGSLFNSANTYSIDSTPDFLVKVAFDPGWGHYEVFGMDRTFRDRVPGSGTTLGHNNSTNGVSFGGSVLLPLVPKIVDFQASVLSGEGAGRYGSAQLPDATFAPNGDVETVKVTTFLAGLVAHPTPTLDLYAYWGEEKADAKADAILSGTGAITGYTGYGIPTLDLSGCNFEGGTCAQNNGKYTQGTIGGWWKFYRGAIGNFQLGLQISSTKVEALPGLKGYAPDSKMNIGMVSIRYYPYQ
jgi:hypothetical protein